MIVRTLEDVIGSDHHVVGEGFESRRILLKPDGLGYSFHDTIVEEGHEIRIEFKNHVESNYCIAMMVPLGDKWSKANVTKFIKHPPNAKRA